MRLHLPSAFSLGRKYQIVLFAGIAVLVSGVCDAAMVTYNLEVPRTPPGKQSPGGWGAIVLQLDAAVTGGSFVFEPECPEPGDGSQNGFLKPGDPTVIQLGPGNYGLLPTGSEVTQEGSPFFGQERGRLEITLTYDNEPPPRIMFTESFWQSKPRPGGTRTWTFDSEELDTYLPEPSGIALALCGGGLLMASRRKRAGS